mgnify:CR=1 FL=1
MTIVNEIKNEKAIKYDVKSSKAEEFINDAEILASIEYGRENKDNIELQREFLEKAGNLKGLTHREASVLLHSENEEIPDSTEIVSCCLHRFTYQITA